MKQNDEVMFYIHIYYLW